MEDGGQGNNHRLGEAAAGAGGQQELPTQGMIVPVYPARTPVNSDLWPRIHTRLLDALADVDDGELDALPAEFRNAHGCMGFLEVTYASRLI